MLPECSTPEGIGGGISWPEIQVISQGRSAQRPKASEGESGPLGNWGKVRRRSRCDSRTLVKAGGHVKRVGCAVSGSVEDLLTWISWVVKERSFRRCWWFLRPCPRFHALVLDSVLDSVLDGASLAVWSHATTRPAQRGQRSRISKASSSARLLPPGFFRQASSVRLLPPGLSQAPTEAAQPGDRRVGTCRALAARVRRPCRLAAWQFHQDTQTPLSPRTLHPERVT